MTMPASPAAKRPNIDLLSLSAGKNAQNDDRFVCTIKLQDWTSMMNHSANGGQGAKLSPATINQSADQ